MVGEIKTLILPKIERIMLKKNERVSINIVDFGMKIEQSKLKFSKPTVFERSSQKKQLNELISLKAKIIHELKRVQKEPCIVCRLPLKKNDPIAICPHCSGKAHLLHWNAWIQRQHFCPRCRTKI